MKCIHCGKDPHTCICPITSSPEIDQFIAEVWAPGDEPLMSDDEMAHALQRRFGLELNQARVEVMRFLEWEQENVKP